MTKQIRKFAIMITLAIAISFAISAFSASAYTIPEQFRPLNEPFGIGKELDSSQGGSTTSGTIVFLQILAGGLLYFAAPIAVIIIIMTGFNMALLGAESEKIEEAKRSLTWAATGLFLIIFSYTLVRIIIASALQAASS